MGKSRGNQGKIMETSWENHFPNVSLGEKYGKHMENMGKSWGNSWGNQGLPSGRVKIALVHGL